jgi:hypothetical protein
MKSALTRLPWFVAVPAFIGALVVAAVAANYLGADYFRRTRLDEVNPLASASAVAGAGPTAFGSASPSASAPTSPASAQTPASAGGAVVLARGNFRDGEPGHRGSGVAMLGRDAAGNPVLGLEDFSVTNGPNLHVILGATAEGGGDGIDLGKLKATDGTFSYAIPEGTDLAQFRSVTIWCASFPTVFAVAALDA